MTLIGSTSEPVSVWCLVFDLGREFVGFLGDGQILDFQRGRKAGFGGVPRNKESVNNRTRDEASLSRVAGGGSQAACDYHIVWVLVRRTDTLGDIDRVAVSIVGLIQALNPSQPLLPATSTSASPSVSVLSPSCTVPRTVEVPDRATTVMPLPVSRGTLSRRSKRLVSLRLLLTVAERSRRMACEFLTFVFRLFRCRGIISDGCSVGYEFWRERLLAPLEISLAICLVVAWKGGGAMGCQFQQLQQLAC